MYCGENCASYFWQPIAQTKSKALGINMVGMVCSTLLFGSDISVNYELALKSGIGKIEQFATLGTDH